MPTANVECGIGAERRNALASAGRGRRETIRAYNSGVNRERAMLKITLDGERSHKDYLQGDLVSVQDRKAVPLDVHLPFAGIIENVGEESGVYVAAVCVRGAVCVRVNGLNSKTPTGAKVYAMPAGHTQVFSLEKEGVLVGELCAIESAEREMGIVGFRLPTDERPFEIGGRS